MTTRMCETFVLVIQRDENRVEGVEGDVGKVWLEQHKDFIGRCLSSTERENQRSRDLITFHCPFTNGNRGPPRHPSGDEINLTGNPCLDRIRNAAVLHKLGEIIGRYVQLGDVSDQLS